MPLWLRSHALKNPLPLHFKCSMQLGFASSHRGIQLQRAFHVVEAAEGNLCRPPPRGASSWLLGPFCAAGIYIWRPPPRAAEAPFPGRGKAGGGRGEREAPRPLACPAGLLAAPEAGGAGRGGGPAGAPQAPAARGFLRGSGGAAGGGAACGRGPGAACR